MLPKWCTALTCATVLSGSLSVAASPDVVTKREAASLSSIYVQAHNASSSDIAAAHEIIRDALIQDAELNTERFNNPARNNFSLRPNTSFGKRDGDPNVPPLLEITDELAAAAALLTTLESPNSTVAANKRAGGWWMGGLDRKGTVPLGDDSSYKVFRNVVDYGADPAGEKVC